MDERLFLRFMWGLLLLGLAIVAVGRYTDIYLLVGDWMYDTVGRDFPWKNTWFSSVFMHRWVRGLFTLIGLIGPALLIADSLFSSKRLSPELRRKFTVVALSAILIPLTISLLKNASIHHCPWDLQRYGGFAPYLRLFGNLPPGMEAGHCFPAGHASSALWTGAIWVFWLPHQPRRALLAFTLGLLPGLALGWVQQMRGAHFLSHTLWSTWIAILIILLLTRWLLPAPPRT